MFNDTEMTDSTKEASAPVKDLPPLTKKPQLVPGKQQPAKKPPTPARPVVASSYGGDASKVQAIRKLVERRVLLWARQSADNGSSEFAKLSEASYILSEIESILA